MCEDFESDATTSHPLIRVVQDWTEFLNHRRSGRLRHHVSRVVCARHMDQPENVVVHKFYDALGLCPVAEGVPVHESLPGLLKPDAFALFVATEKLTVGAVGEWCKRRQGNMVHVAGCHLLCHFQR